MGNNQSSLIIPLIPVLWCYGMPLSCLFGVENCWGAHAFPCKLKRLEESVRRPRLQRQRHRQRTGVPPVEFATKQAGIRSTMGERMWAEGREVKPHGTAGARSPARLRFNGSAAALETARHTPQDLRDQPLADHLRNTTHCAPVTIETAFKTCTTSFVVSSGS